MKPINQEKPKPEIEPVTPLPVGPPNTPEIKPSPEKTEPQHPEPEIHPEPEPKTNPGKEE